MDRSAGGKSRKKRLIETEEGKEKRLFHRRNDSPPESVYLPSQPEKSHRWTHG